MLLCASCGYVNETRQEAVRQREEHERNVVGELGTTFDTLLNKEPSSVEQLDTLYQLLPLTIEDICRLQETWYDLAFGLNFDPRGVPPPNERAIPLLHHDPGYTKFGRAGEGDNRVNSRRRRKAAANGGYVRDRWDICGYSGIFKYTLCFVGWPCHAHLVQRPSLVHLRIGDELAISRYS